MFFCIFFVKPIEKFFICVIIIISICGGLIMNKNELIRVIANKTGFTLKDAATSLDGVLGAITDALKDGEKIQISGFGTFEMKTKSAREGINPKTQEKITIAETKVPSFKFGKAYKDSFN